MSTEALVELKDGINAKLKAMKQLADLAGYNEAAKLEVKSSATVTTIDITATPEEAARAYTEMMEGN